MKPVSHTPTRIGLAHLVALLAVAMVIGGCSSVGDAIEGKGSIDYKSPGERPRLDVPPDLVTPKGDDRYSVPERQKRERTYSGFQSTRAADRAGGDARVLPSLQGMRIERAGSQRWLVVNQPADRLWPVIREFWQDSGFQIETESPATGIMQTGWAENRAKLPLDFIRRTLGKVLENLYSTGERDRFRTRLEKTSEGTEIYISHRGMIEVLTGAPPQESTVWQPRPSDPELEAEFLKRLMIKLGAGQLEARQAIEEGKKPQEGARLVCAAGNATLEIRDQFDRAWRRVGLALDRGAFTVEDRDRSKGVFFVRYIDPEVSDNSKKGFFNRLFSFGSSKKESAQQYQIVVQTQGELSSIAIRSKDGQVLKEDVDLQTSRKILALLQDQLK